MLKIIGLWTLFGVLIQIAGGIIIAHETIKLERETGRKYDDRYTVIFAGKMLGKVVPLTKYVFHEYMVNGLSLGYIVGSIINNLWGYIIWPIHFPIMMQAYDKARKAFLNDIKSEP